MFANFESEFSTCKGRKKESIYKENLFSGMDKDTKKKTRIKLRKMRTKFASEIIASNAKKDNTKLASFIKDFKTFYNTCYLVNDFSLSSLCSANTESEEKEKVNKMLDIIAKFDNKKSNK